MVKNSFAVDATFKIRISKILMFFLEFSSVAKKPL